MHHQLSLTVLSLLTYLVLPSTFAEGRHFVAVFVAHVALRHALRLVSMAFCSGKSRACTHAVGRWLSGLSLCPCCLCLSSSFHFVLVFFLFSLFFVLSLSLSLSLLFSASARDQICTATLSAQNVQRRIKGTLDLETSLGLCVLGCLPGPS